MTAADSTASEMNHLKVLLAEPSKRIELDDFISEHVNRVLEATSLEHFPVQGGTPRPEDVRERIAQYESLVGDLQQIVVLTSKWATADQSRSLETAFARLGESEKGSGGLTIWLHLGWYPALYLMYSAGISALASQNYDALRAILLAPVLADERGVREDLALVVRAFNNTDDDAFRHMAGQERKHAPRSEYLFETLRSMAEENLSLGRRYEWLFDEYEVLAAIEYYILTERPWGPAGRFAWKHKHTPEYAPLKQLVRRVTKEGNGWKGFQAGLFGGSVERFVEAADAIEQMIGRLNWF